MAGLLPGDGDGGDEPEGCKDDAAQRHEQVRHHEERHQHIEQLAEEDLRDQRSLSVTRVGVLLVPPGPTE
jgi:hypothetical protein